MVAQPPSDDPSAIVLFDGACNLCNGSVRFMIANDKRRRLRFASLQSETARLIAEHFGRNPGSFSSVVLVERERLHERSDAALRIANYLDWPWPLAALLLAIPADVRNRAYDAIARNRYRVFGTTAACPLPTPDVRDRFL
jgi:predicted DCC family thiol-disulfide oxidoreductase YuxK